MGAFHWLIVVPYYFVAALAVLPLLILTCRLLRAKLSINALVGAAIVLALAGIVLPLVSGIIEVSALTGRPLLVLICASLILAAIDAALSEALPLPLDGELREL